MKFYFLFQIEQIQEFYQQVVMVLNGFGFIVIENLLDIMKQIIHQIIGKN